MPTEVALRTGLAAEPGLAACRLARVSAPLKLWRKLSQLKITKGARLRLMCDTVAPLDA